MHKDVALICSRQALRPTGGTPWVSALSQAIKHLARQGNFRIVTSIGTLQYEMTATLASLHNLPVLLLVNNDSLRKLNLSSETLSDFVRAEFNLPSEDYKSQIVKTPRDPAVCEHAKVIYPISIRPGGTFDALLSQETNSVKRNDQFLIPYSARGRTIKRDYSQRRINLSTQSSLQGHLVHWTRGTSHPWPGETRFRFCKSILESTTRYSHGAFETLLRILFEANLRASCRHMPLNEPMVSFTEAILSDAVKLMRYRARYREMTFEPFGLALPKRLTSKFEIKPVIYLDQKSLRTIKPPERFFAQSSKTQKANWRPEAEWRKRGDLNLAQIRDEIMALAPDRQTADEIQFATNIRVLPVFAD